MDRKRGLSSAASAWWVVARREPERVHVVIGSVERVCQSATASAVIEPRQLNDDAPVLRLLQERDQPLAKITFIKASQIEARLAIHRQAGPRPGERPAGR